MEKRVLVRVIKTTHQDHLRIVQSRFCYVLPCLYCTVFLSHQRHGLLVHAARLIVEVIHRDWRAQPDFGDRVLPSPDHPELGGHLHQLEFASRVTPARLHEQFGSGFAVGSAGRAP